MTTDVRQTIGAAEAAGMARKHIPCVHGASMFLDVLRALFDEESYNVTTTNFVPRTLAMIEAPRPDLVRVDLVIGRRAGWKLLEGLAREAATRGIPVLITSTDQRLRDAAEADPARYGGRAFIIKPLDIADLLATVRRLIGRA